MCELCGWPILLATRAELDAIPLQQVGMPEPRLGSTIRRRHMNHGCEMVGEYVATAWGRGLKIRWSHAAVVHEDEIVDLERDDGLPNELRPPACGLSVDDARDHGPIEWKPAASGLQGDRLAREMERIYPMVRTLLAIEMAAGNIDKARASVFLKDDELAEGIYCQALMIAERNGWPAPERIARARPPLVKGGQGRPDYNG